MEDKAVQKLEASVESLHKKLDAYHEQTIKNTTDVAWLKRGMFGSFFTYIGVIAWTALGLGNK